MKLLLLKVLLQRRARDEGFTLPMVIALGLVMLLLGAINITVANEENITAISQNSRSDALAIAEVGIARYRELLDRNRILALYDERPQTTAEAAASTDTERWGELTEICDDNIASFLRGTSNPITLDEDGQVLNNDGDSTDIFNIGSYSLVSYDYINDNDTDNDPATIGIADGQLDLSDDAVNNNARGKLTVRGTAPNNAGEAQIEVEIPIRINLEDMTNLAPALWIGNNGISVDELKPLNVNNGNIVIRDPAVTTSGSEADGCRNFAEDPNPTTGDNSPNLADDSDIAITLGTVISDSRDLPPISEVIANVAAARTAYSVASGDPINTPIPIASDPLDPLNLDQLLFGATTHLPYNPDPTATPTDCSNIKLCRYYYDFPGAGAVTYNDQDLLTDGVARTTLLLDQPLTISATSEDIKIGSTSDVVNDSNAFEIYSTNDITIDTGGNNITINGFLHAPQSTLTIEGGGTVTINGAVWVGDFVNDDSTAVTISPDLISREATPSDPSTSGRGYKFYSTTAERTARPLTGSPTNWKTEQIN